MAQLMSQGQTLEGLTIVSTMVSLNVTNTVEGKNMGRPNNNCLLIGKDRDGGGNHAGG